MRCRSGSPVAGINFRSSFPFTGSSGSVVHIYIETVEKRQLG